MWYKKIKWVITTWESFQCYSVVNSVKAGQEESSPGVKLKSSNGNLDEEVEVQNQTEKYTITKIENVSCQHLTRDNNFSFHVLEMN